MQLFQKYKLTLFKFFGIGIKFGLTGTVGFVINYSLLRLLTTTIVLSKLYAEIIATIVALQITFVLNNYWTYSVLEKENELVLSLKKRYIAYIMSNLVGSVITITVFWILSGPLNNDLFSLFLAAVFGMTWNFFANLFITWRPKLRPNKQYIESID